MTKPALYKDNSKPKSFLEALQSAIINRVVKPYNKNEPVIYEFTQDRGLLYQYYLLRQAMYRKMFSSDNFDGGEDLHDKLSHILIARRGNLCLGGCRLTIREYDEMWALPMESEHFKVRELFPELPLGRVRHAEISRFAVMEDSGDKDIFYGLCKVMYDKVIDSNIHYLFAKSTLVLARNWRLVANSFGVKTTKICNDLKIPEIPIHPTIDADVKWYVTMSDMSSYCHDELPQPKVEMRKPASEKAHLSLVD
jgi:hypothetical protein